MKGRRLLGGKKGQALVEFAVVLPMLVVLLVGMIEFGLLLYNQHVITNASREGARFGIVVRPDVRRNLVEISEVVNHYAENNMITFGVLAPPETTIAFIGQGFGDDLTVTVEFHYDFLVLPNFLGTLIGGTDLHAQTTMKYE